MTSSDDNDTEDGDANDAGKTTDDPAELGPAELGPAELGPAELGPAELGSAELGRRLVRRAGQAALATAQCDADGWPYPSPVLVATDPAGRPLLLVSGLADHTRNLHADPRAGLLFEDTRGLAEPLTGPRLSVLGHMAPVEDRAALDRYLARHPGERAYAGFGDFHLWRMEPERAYLVAGFGRIHWMDGSALLSPAALWRPLEEASAAILRDANEHRAEEILVCATRLLGARPGPWRMASVDPDGCDLTNGPLSIRLAFGQAVATPDAVREELTRLAMEAGADNERKPQ